LVVLTSDATKAKRGGFKPRIKEVKEKLDQHYIVLPTSNIIKHDDAPHCHLFITLREENYQ